ncbi:Ig-like domain-containing protein [Fictibacillus iocasae]|uniref:Ig-like domain-containing protein n=1 Tax=Fictibacillus iocasae TaxID=2715437 RepID=A0ABW2NU42_9BACL
MLNKLSGYWSKSLKGPRITYVQPYSLKVIELDTMPPVPPIVNRITAKSTAVAGKAEKGATVTVKRESTVIGTATVNSAGAFSARIAKQKAGTVLYVTAKDAAGNVSKAVKAVVQK